HEVAAAIGIVRYRRRNPRRCRIALRPSAGRTGPLPPAHAIDPRRMFDLNDLRAHGGEEAPGPGARQHPAEIDHPHVREGERLAVMADQWRFLPALGGNLRRGERARRHPLAQDLVGMLTQTRRARPATPRHLAAHPFGTDISEAAAKLRMLRLEEGIARFPLRIAHILLRAAERR